MSGYAKIEREGHRQPLHMLFSNGEVHISMMSHCDAYDPSTSRFVKRDDGVMAEVSEWYDDDDVYHEVVIRLTANEQQALIAALQSGGES